MKVKLEEIEQGMAVTIEGDLTIYHVAELKEKLLETLNTYPGIELDLDGVTGCDAAGLQILCAAGKTVRKGNRKFKIDRLSAIVQKTMASAGRDGF